MSRKYLDDKSVQALSRMLKIEDIPVSRVAGALGISRPHLSQMLNQNQPMLRVYGLAIRQYVTDTRLHRIQHNPGD